MDKSSIPLKPNSQDQPKDHIETPYAKLSETVTAVKQATELLSVSHRYLGEA